MHGKIGSVIWTFVGSRQAIRKTRAVVHVAGEPGAERQIRGESGVKCVALIVVERDVIGAEVAGRVGGDGAGKSADDVASLFGDLVGVGEMKLAQASQAWRAQGHRPRAD